MCDVCDRMSETALSIAPTERPSQSPTVSPVVLQLLFLPLLHRLYQASALPLTHRLIPAQCLPRRLARLLEKPFRDAKPQSIGGTVYCAFCAAVRRANGKVIAGKRRDLCAIRVAVREPQPPDKLSKSIHDLPCRCVMHPVRVVPAGLHVG